MKIETPEQILKNPILEQSPGFLGTLSLDSKLLTVNKVGLSWIGFDSPDSVVGVSYDNLRCKATEDAELFRYQDKLVQKNSKPIYFIDCYYYADNSWKIIFGKKYLIKDTSGKSIAIVSHFDDVTHYRAIDTSRFIIQSGKRLLTKKHQQFCYLLNDYTQKTNLSMRELECLFFLLRGKTIKTIGQILRLSPRTVESYINQIKFKMGCSTRIELIEKAINEGYINILPSSLLDK